MATLTAPYLHPFGDAIRIEKEVDGELPPTTSSPVSHRIAFDLQMGPLGCDAVIALLGHVDDISGLATGMRIYVRALPKSKAPSLEDLCAHALFGAGVLSVKQRSELFGRM